MVDADTRGSRANESEPTAPALGSGDNENFQMGIAGARDYKELLSQGVLRESPGAPIPFNGPTMSDEQYASLYGPNNSDTDVPAAASQEVGRFPVVQGTHKDPMAGWINDGSVPAGTTGGSGVNVRPQGSTHARTSQFNAGERD